MTEQTQAKRQREPLRPEMAAYIAAVIAAGSAVWAYLWVAGDRSFQPLDLYYAVAMAAMIAAARQFPLQLAAKKKVVLDTAAAFGAVLLLPAPLAVTTCVLGHICGQIPVRAPLLQKSFNSGTMALQSGIAALLASSLPRAQFIGGGTVNLLSVVACGAALYVVNVLSVEGIVSLQLKRRPFARWWANNRQNCQNQVALLGLGAAAVALTEVHPLMLFMVLVPTGLVHRSLSCVTRLLQYQTRDTVVALADVVDMRDHYTFEHSVRVAEMAREMSTLMGLSPDDVETVYLAARVHDVGKIGIKGQVLLKPAALTEEEWSEMRTHPEVGAKLVENMPEFRSGREIILAHHERFDGKGYPRALAGMQIPLGARIIAVVDAYDAMTSHRPYRSALETDAVLEQLRRGRGRQFDPGVVDTFTTWLAKQPETAREPAQPAGPRAVDPALAA